MKPRPVLVARLVVSRERLRAALAPEAAADTVAGLLLRAVRGHPWTSVVLGAVVGGIFTFAQSRNAAAPAPGSPKKA